MSEMIREICCDEGYLKMKSEADRIAIATLLFKSGYAVRTIRKKINGRYEYFVRYERCEKEGE